MLNRRRILAFLGWSLAGLGRPRAAASLVLPGPDPSQACKGFDPDRLFGGKRYNYDVCFWWFNPAGKIYLSFQKRTGGRGYLALAGGRTTGFVGTLTRRMTFRYRAFMTYDQEANRLISQRFEEESIQGRRTYRSVRVFDHDAGIIHHLKPRRYGEPREIREELPGPEMVDHLTAFFNWRAGVYGPPLPGRSYFIPTMPSHGNKETAVYFKSAEETDRMRRVENTDLPFLLDVRIAQRMVYSSDGRIIGWTDQEFVPHQFTIPGVRIIGTARVRLIGWERIPRFTDLGPLFPSDHLEPAEELF